jgi:hypothetical protein
MQQPDNVSSSSLVRQNYAAEVEAAVNKQINIELYASYVYLSMVRYLIIIDLLFAVVLF